MKVKRGGSGESGRRDEGVGGGGAMEGRGRWVSYWEGEVE